MTKLKVDGREVEVPDHYTLLQACEEAGAEIPRFCFHERLSIAGNCRMCLVEVKGGPPKPAASCAMGVRDLRPGPEGQLPEVFTTTPMVKKAREGVMEFLLINHPLDCPICDQGGECDLQDQAMAYGVDSSRYQENKRAVEDKYIGPLVKTIMTRCIHCTRCVRFTTEVAGISELGLVGRGEDAEITTFLEQAMTSELQGNVIDLCPVGALTSRPYAFQARPWELSKTETVDVMDAVGSSIRVDTRGREVMRILPRTNEEINEEWISDKTRFIWDGLRTQRLDRPYVRRGRTAAPGKLAGSVRRHQGEGRRRRRGQDRRDRRRSRGGRGDVGAEAADGGARLAESRLPPGWREARSRRGYGRPTSSTPPSPASRRRMRSLIVGSNPRFEASVLNARIRKRWRMGGFPIGVVGANEDLRYDYTYLGAGPDTLADLEGASQGFFEALKNAERPMIIVGQGALAGENGSELLASLAALAREIGAVTDGWNGFNVLHSAASRVGGLDIGFVPGEGGRTFAQMAGGAVDVLFNLGADEVEVAEGPFVVYIGTHGDRGAHRADVILPGAAYTEKSGTWVNLEGRAQVGSRAAFPPGDAREDWAILRALSAVLGKTLPFDSLAALRSELYQAHPFMRTDRIEPADAAAITGLADRAGALKGAPFASNIGDFYLTNPIARASKVMAECSQLAKAEHLQAAE